MRILKDWLKKEGIELDTAEEEQIGDDLRCTIERQWECDGSTMILAGSTIIISTGESSSIYSSDMILEHDFMGGWIEMENYEWEEARDEYNSLFPSFRDACEFESLVLNGLEHHMFKGQFDELWDEIQGVIAGDITQPSDNYWNFLIEQKQQLND